MQASKARNGSSEAPQKSSPVTPKTSRIAKKTGSDSDSATSKITPGRSSTEWSPKITGRRTPKSLVSEKPRLIKLSELECRVTQLQEDLKKANDHLSSSESSKQQAQLEADEAKKKLTAMEAKLEESQCQLVEFSNAEDARLQELRKISQERDRAWQSELESFEKQHSIDSASLASAMSEIQRLKHQLDTVAKSEADQMEDSQMAQTQLETLKNDMEATLLTVERLQLQISEKEKAEEEAKQTVSEAQKQLEMANATIETLRIEGCNLQESLKLTKLKLEESRSRVDALQTSEADIVESDNPSPKVESFALQYELEQLRAALEVSEAKIQEEQIQATMQIQSAYEMAEQVKINAGLRELELESTLQKTKADLLELKDRFHNLEMELQSLSQSNKEDIEKAKASEYDSHSKLMRATTDITELKSNLLDKETELQSIMEENEQLKSELFERDSHHQKSYAAAIADTEKARGGERDALMKLNLANAEAENERNKAAKALEQLEAAQAMKSEMQAESRRIKVQSDQWRKAAEAAAAVLTPENNGRVVERTISSLDSDYNSLSGKLMSSPLSDGLYDESSPKKKSGNMLKKLGLWKKGQK